MVEQSADCSVRAIPGQEWSTKPCQKQRANHWASSTWRDEPVSRSKADEQSGPSVAEAAEAFAKASLRSIWLIG
jgi:hypothetical protein